MKGHKRGPDGTFLCPTNFPLPPTSRVTPIPFPRQGTAPQKVTPPIRRGLTIELDDKGNQVFVNGHRYSKIMPGTLDSQVWAWMHPGGTSRQGTPGIVEVEDGNYIEIIDDDDDDDEVEYIGEIPRLSTRPPSLQPRMFSIPHRTPAPSTHRHSIAPRDLGKRRQLEQDREMSIVSTTGGDWPLASLYRIQSDRVRQVVREAESHGLYARVIPRSRVVPVPVEDVLPWVKEEYAEEDSGFFEDFGEGSSGRVMNGNGGSRRAGKERERDRDWEVILGTDEGAVEHLQRLVLNDQEDERQRESRRAVAHHAPPVVNNPPPLALSAPVAVTPIPHPGTSWSSILAAMLIGAIAMFYVLVKMPDD